MTLLVTLFAAIICTVIWYKAKDNKMCLSTLCYMFWGASIMWFVDACFEYGEAIGKNNLEPQAYFEGVVKEALPDFLLGLSVIGLALLIWVIVLLIKDPMHKLHKSIKTGNVEEIEEAKEVKLDK